MENRRGISYRGFIPVRREPSDSSEMVSQVLFGETFRILEEEEQWTLISLDFDLYEGWVGKGSINVLKSNNGPEMETDAPLYETGSIVKVPFTTVMDLNLSSQLILPAGSVCPEASGSIASIGGRRFEILNEDAWIKPHKDSDPEEIGNGLISISYLWGGRSGFGFDCSGLVQTLCRMMGIHIPRDSKQQAGLGSIINFIHEIRKGDLAFFENASGEIAHVGMVLDQGRILHSHNQVRIDKLDQQGIYNTECEDYTHKLRIIKRIVSTT